MTVSLNGNPRARAAGGVTFAEDNVTPAINDPVAYIDGGKTIVKFGYTVGGSGIQKVTANGSIVTPEYGEGNTATVTLNSAQSEVYLIITNNVNVPSDSVSVTPAEALGITVTGAPDTAVTGYYKETFDYTVTYTGLTNGVTLQSAKLGDENFDNENPVANTEVNGKTLTITDSQGRTASYDFPTMIQDDQGPSIVFNPAEAELKGKMVNEDQTIEVKISDEGSGLAENIVVTYEITKGVNNYPGSYTTRPNYTADGKSATATITVTNGETLGTVQPTDVKDVLGNVSYESRKYNVTVDTEAPKVTATLENVVGIKKDAEGNIVLLVEEIETGNNESVIVVLKVDIEDDNLAGSGHYENGAIYQTNGNDNTTLDYEFLAIDRAGNVAKSMVLTAGGTSVTLTPDNDGRFEGEFAIEAVDTENNPIPSIEFVEPDEIATVTHGITGEDAPLYTGNIVFGVTVDPADAEIEATWSDGLDVVYDDGNGTLTVSAADANGTETDSAWVTLTVKVGDESYSFTKYFAWDNQAPEVKITIPDADGTDGTNQYYKNNVKATVTVTDLFLNEVTVNGESVTPGNGKATKHITVDSSVTNIKVTATDMANNEDSGEKSNIIVDTIDPSITAEEPNLSDQKCTYTFEATDVNLNSVTTTYKLVGETEEKIATVSEIKDGKATVTIEVPEGGQLESYTITATDKAGRTATRTLQSDESILVDTINPVVTVEPAETALYSNEIVTYTITIEDATINESVAVKHAVYTYEEGGIEKRQSVTFQPDGTNQVKGEFDLTNGQKLTGIAVTAMDAVGNDGSKSYVYNTLVDTEKPTGNLTFELVTEDEVELTGFYTRGEEDKSYLQLEYDADPENLKSLQVKATLTVKDDNLGTSGLTGTGWTLNEDGTATFTQTSAVVNENNTAAFNLEFAVKDLAGNIMEFGVDDITAVASSTAAAGTTPAYTYDQTTGTVKINLMIDFRKPTSGEDNVAPSIYVTTSSSGVHTFDGGKVLYGGPNMGSITFNTTIRDNTAVNDDQNAGLETATYSIDDVYNSGVVTEVTDQPLTINAESGKVEDQPIIVAFNDGCESNNVTLTLYAKDYAGNAITGPRTFAVDKLAPRITTSYDSTKGNTVGGNVYFGEHFNVNVNVDELNFDAVKTGITSTGSVAADWTTNGNTRTKTVTFGEGEHTLSAESTDLAGNLGTFAEEQFIIDTTPADISIVKDYAGTEILVTAEKMHYHDQNVTYNITITDEYLDNVTGAAPSITISYELNGTPVSESLPADDNSGNKVGKVLYHETDAEGNDVYTYSLPLTDGDRLTKLSVNVTDNAGKTSSKSELANETVVVDTTSPVLKVEKVGTVINTANGHDFYNSDVTFKFTVTDTNLDEESSVFANASKYILNNEDKDIKWTISGTEMTAEFKVLNAQLLSTFALQIKDAAGNPAVVEDAVTGELIAVDTADASKWNYKGNPIVVDTTAPTANITMTSSDNNQLVGFYTDAAGVTYVKLKNPTTNGSAKDEVEVTLTLTVTDYNLGIGEGLTSAVENSWAKGTGSWNEGYLINNEGTAVHKRTVKVKTNATGQIVLDPVVVDLAGNVIKTEGITIEPINNTVPGNDSVKADQDGKVTGIITLDRRQVTSGNDTAAPYVELIPSSAASSKTNGGLELFNKSFSFSLKVTDGENNTLNSGLQPNGDEGMGSVTWELTDDGDGDFVTAAAANTTAGTHDYATTINIKAGAGECNTFHLTVKAVDNVGNTIVYVRNFAVDTLAPRVSVEFDNNDVRNERYFRAERTATIIVDELNFDPANTNIDTEVKPSNWGVDAQGRYVATCEYAEDGDYTLFVDSTDLAGNHTADGNVNYIGAACQDFTVDMTLPEIQVFYDPDVVSGVDEEGVEYYDQDQRIGVRITEHNFNDEDVVAEFYINRDMPLGRGLSAFESEGDVHNASILLEDGNRYFFRVDYTDLAGNVAVGYTSNFFSVDTVAPTIKVISDTLVPDEMNVVSGDLDLSFVIDDAQENLDNYHIVITHTNNKFETVVVSGPEFLTVHPQKDRKTVTINIANIQKLKELDGIYTIQLRAYDYAGNTTILTPPMVISLNRFGSTFTTNDPFTKEFLTPGSDGVVYRNSVNGNLIIQEINPNRVFNDATLKVEGSVLTIVVNGRSIRLEKDKDYTMTVEKSGQEGSHWYTYTYEIDKKVFEENGELLNGRYSILIYGVDEALNNNTNESSEYSTVQMDADGKYTGKIEFTIDTQDPVIITTGIESGEIYNAEFKQMQIEIADATPTSIQVYLNDEVVPLSVDSTNLPENTLWLTQDEETGIYTLNVNEQSGIFSRQNVHITATDAATNASEADVSNFHISTSLIVRMLNSVWFYVILAGVAAAVIAVIFVSKKKKNTV